jgi:hypothetical protein
MIVSVIAAALIWFMISMRETYSVVREFPVEYVNLPSDSAFREYPISNIRARVQGPGWQLLKLYTSTTPIKLEPSGGQVDLFQAASRSLAPDLIPQSVNPASAVIPLEGRTVKRVPVRLRSEITTAPPFDLLAPIQIRPDSVTISGAESVVSRIRYWPTEVLEGDRVNRSFSTTLRLADSLETLVEKSITQVSVAVTVAEFTENRRLLSINVIGAPTGEATFRLIPEQVAVRYRVPIAQFEASAVTDSFYAAVAYTEILSDTTGRVTPTVHLPRDIVIRDVTVETSRLQYYVVLE